MVVDLFMYLYLHVHTCTSTLTGKILPIHSTSSKWLSLYVMHIHPSQLRIPHHPHTLTTEASSSLRLSTAEVRDTCTLMVQRRYMTVLILSIWHTKVRGQIYSSMSTPLLEAELRTAAPTPLSIGFPKERARSTVSTSGANLITSRHMQ